MGPTEPVHSVEDFEEDGFHQRSKPLDLTKEFVRNRRLSRVVPLPSKVSLDKTARKTYLYQNEKSILASAKRDWKPVFIAPIMPNIKLVSSKLLECRSLKHGSIFLCGSCSLKLAGKDVISHITALNHQKMRRVVVNLNEKSYNNILKQNFQSALHTLKALNLMPFRRRKASSASLCAKLVNTSVILHGQHASTLIEKKVANAEFNSSDSGTPAVMETTFKTARIPPAFGEPIMTCTKVSKLNSLHAHQSGTSVGQGLKRNVSTEDTKGAHLPPYSRRNGKETSAAGNAVCKVKSLTLKSSAVASATPTKCTTPSKMIKTATSNAVVLNASAAKSVTVPLQGRIQAISRVKSQFKAVPFSQAGSTVVQKTTCRTSLSSKSENASRCTQTASKASLAPHCNRTLMATVKMPELPIKHENTVALDKSAHVGANANCEPRALKRNPAVAPHTNAVMPVLTKLTKPHKEPCPLSASKEMQSKNHPKVGLNQLIVVSWEGKQQVYCQLCSVRLKRSNHSCSFLHQYNYVKMKYPGWAAKPEELESQLKNIVAHLAEVEKSVGSQNAQKVEVHKDVYLKLAVLPEDKAVETVKAMMRRRDEQVSSSTLNTAEPLKREFGSPCDVSCSDDGLCVPYETSGISSDDQSEQQNKDLHQPLVQIPELWLNVKGKSNLITFGGVSIDEEDTKASDPVHQLQPSMSLNKNHLEPVPGHSSSAEVVAETVQQEQLKPISEVQSHVEITNVIENPGEAHRRINKYLVKHDDEQKWNRDPRSKDPQKEVDCRRRLSHIEMYSAEVQTATVDAGQPSLQGLKHKEQAPKGGLKLGEHRASQQKRISVGGRAQGCSHLSIYLKASQQYDKPVIGMGSIWECRGMSLKTFFLCESCEETLSCHDVCQHMVSLQHQLKYLWRKYPEFLKIFWLEDDLLIKMKMDILNDVILELSKREQLYKMDAQCILLGQELHEFVRTAQFSEALKILKNFKHEGKPRVFFLPISSTCQKSHQPNNRQGFSPDKMSALALDSDQRPHSGQKSLKESISTETLTPVINPNKRAGRENTRKNGKCQSEKETMVGDLAILNPLILSCYSETNANVCEVANVGIDQTLEEACSFRSKQPEFIPAVTQLKTSDSQLNVKRENASLEMLSFGTSVNQNVEVSFCPPTRKRLPDTPVEMLLRSCNSHLLEAKCKLGPQQAKSGSLSTSESILQNSASNPIPQSLKGDGVRPSHLSHTVDKNCMEKSVSIMKKDNFSMNLSPSTNKFCSTSSSHPMESRWDSKIQMHKSETAIYKRKWDSKCQLVKVTVKNNPLH